MFAAPLAGLLALLAWECLPSPAEPELPPPAAAPRTVHAAPPETPPVPVWTDIVLARPLFAPDRRPATAAPSASAPLPRLSGTIRSDDNMLAIFAAPGSTPEAPGKSIAVGRSGSVAGWTIADITDGAVTLQRGARSATLRISFTNAPVVALTEAPKVVLLHDKQTSPFLQP
jgi:general secretion pathway protein N